MRYFKRTPCNSSNLKHTLARCNLPESTTVTWKSNRRVDSGYIVSRYNHERWVSVTLTQVNEAIVILASRWLKRRRQKWSWVTLDSYHHCIQSCLATVFDVQSPPMMQVPTDSLCRRDLLLWQNSSSAKPYRHHSASTTRCIQFVSSVYQYVFRELILWIERIWK